MPDLIMENPSMNRQQIIKRLLFWLLIAVFWSSAQANYRTNDSTYHAESASLDDPWERFNRNTFSFNEKLDHYLLKPVAVRYETYTPKPAQGLVSNFFGNLGDLRNFANALLQLKLKDAGTSLTRFIINSTIGQLGFVDVSSAIGFETHYQDFGLTLARWNIPSGPYLVLPLFGSGTVRSAVGLVPDYYTYAPNYSRSFSVKSGLTALNVVQKRAQMFQAERLLTGDKYIFIRDAYLQQRYFLITGKQPVDDF